MTEPQLDPIADLTSRDSKDPLLTWDQHFVEAMRLPPVWAGAIIFVVVFGSYLVVAYAFGIPVTDRHLPLGVQGGAWTAFVLSLLAGYSLAATHYVRGKFIEDLRALEPVTTTKAGGLRQLWTESVSRATRMGRIVAWIGFLAGVALWAVTAARMATEMTLARVLMESGWFLIVVPALSAQIAQGAFFTVFGVRMLSNQEDVRIEIDLLDSAVLAPFARFGLRAALVWLIGSTIVLLLFLDLPVRDVPTALVPLSIIGVLAVVALVVPLRRAHREIMRAKRKELDRIHAEIRRDREAVRTRGPEAEGAALRLPGLVAYRSLIDSAREWPLDAPMRTRFFLYLLIPLGGWFGGALVERLIDSLLG
jgi:hypothetical protein